MKKILSLLISIMIFNGLLAQDFNMKVDDHSGKVGKMHHAGLAVHIDLDKKEIKDYWKKELKQMGKIDSDGGVYLIESATFSAVSSQPTRVLSSVESTSKGTRIWMSINKGDGYVKSGSSGYGGAKDFLQSFAKKMYKKDIERQVTDADKALLLSKKNQTKVIETGVSLEKDLQENEEEKIQLEADLEQNKNDQDMAIQNVTDLEEALELVKQKLEKVR